MLLDNEPLEWYEKGEAWCAASSLLDCGLELPYVVVKDGAQFVALFDKTELARGTLDQCKAACEHHACEECDE